MSRRPSMSGAGGSRHADCPEVRGALEASGGRHALADLSVPTPTPWMAASRPHDVHSLSLAGAWRFENHARAKRQAVGAQKRLLPAR
jgi:hypothetical protein